MEIVKVESSLNMKIKNEKTTKFVHINRLQHRIEPQSDKKVVGM